MCLRKIVLYANRRRPKNSLVAHGANPGYRVLRERNRKAPKNSKLLFIRLGIPRHLSESPPRPTLLESHLQYGTLFLLRNSIW